MRNGWGWWRRDSGTFQNSPADVITAGRVEAFCAVSGTASHPSSSAPTARKNARENRIGDWLQDDKRVRRLAAGKWTPAQFVYSP